LCRAVPWLFLPEPRSQSARRGARSRDGQHDPNTKTKTKNNSERELASVKISKEDVEVLAEQVEVDAKAAERRLRECGGDLGKALRSFLPQAAAAPV
jgi:NACalpha-BTF3-like transcription factor